MRIGGFLKLSFCDWPGRPAAVVFTQGCNFRCPWCHNPTLIPAEPEGALIPEEEVLAWLARRRGLLGGVVISGGEPTVQPDLLSFLGRVKSLGLPVQLDTNGSNPGIVAAALQAGLVDRVAVDYKLPARMYGTVCPEGAEGASAVMETVRLVLSAGKGAVRTTAVTGIHDREVIREMEQEVGGYLIVQPWRPPPSVSAKAEAGE
ncbi:MAG: anaerobic ribonucleoside-triphosphate reductase activating protein [Clostridia bacterium]|jgi:pyruvate formate lyase activating enzyme|nr:anaerobic ribonucleoside-triphosphate reductase activating protein [Clostridia bacterium]MDH7572837.1 anaerobic ribonucleoside-triphosphate reductase activating protein [Clostridia bacterium]